MKLARATVVAILVFSLVVVAIARRLTVNVGYGQNGSHGSYVCFLYKDGSLYDVKSVHNTGYATGTVDFDVPTRSYYFAAVYCQTNNTWAFSNGDWFQWYNFYMYLNAQFR